MKRLMTPGIHINYVRLVSVRVRLSGAFCLRTVWVYVGFSNLVISGWLLTMKDRFL